MRFASLKLIFLIAQFYITQAMEQATLASLCQEQIYPELDSLIRDDNERKKLCSLNYKIQQELLKKWPEWQKIINDIRSTEHVSLKLLDDKEVSNILKTPNKTIISYSNENQTAHFWELTTGLYLNNIDLRLNRIYDNNLIKIIDGQVIFENIVTGQQNIIRLNEDNINSCRFYISSDYKRIISYSNETHHVKLWNGQTGALIKCIGISGDPIIGLANNTFILSYKISNQINAQSIVQLFNSETGELIKNIFSGSSLVSFLKYNTQENSLIFSSNEQQKYMLHYYNIKTGTLRTLLLNNRTITHISTFSFSNDNKMAIIVLNAETPHFPVRYHKVIYWNLKNGKNTSFQLLNSEQNSIPQCISYNKELDEIALCFNKQIIVKDKSDNVIYKIEAPESILKVIYIDKSLFCLTSDGKLYFYNSALHEELDRLLIEDAYNIVCYRIKRDKSLSQNISSELQQTVINLYDYNCAII